jgi:hypothetical protein
MMSKSFVISSQSRIPGQVTTIPLQNLDIIAQAISPSRRLRAVLRNVKSGDSSSTTRLVEIWKKDLLVVSANVTECHGDFYADGE